MEMNKGHIYILYISLVYHSILVRIIFRTLSSKQFLPEHHSETSIVHRSEAGTIMETHFTTYFDTADNFFTWRWRVEKSEGFKFQHEDLLDKIREDVLQIIQIHSLCKLKKAENCYRGCPIQTEKRVEMDLTKFFGSAVSHVHRYENRKTKVSIIRKPNICEQMPKNPAIFTYYNILIYS